MNGATMARRIIPKFPNYTKIQVISFVKMKLSISTTWAIRGCLKIYDQQLDHEKRNHLSMGTNGFGFNKIDSPIMSHMACKIKQKRITKSDIAIIQKKIVKYAAQLICLSYDMDKGKNLKIHLNNYYNPEKGLPF